MPRSRNQVSHPVRARGPKGLAGSNRNEVSISFGTRSDENPARGAPMKMEKLVVFDMDANLIEEETLDEIGKLVRKEKEIAAVTARAMRGEMNFEQAVEARLALLKGLRVDAFKKFAKRTPLTKGALATVRALKQAGYNTAIVTGGFDVVANIIAKRLGIKLVAANKLETKNGRLTGRGFLSS